MNTNNTMKIQFKIKGKPTLMHKFNGLKKEGEIKTMPDNEQAKQHAYINDESNLYIPQEWIKGSIANYLISISPPKKGKETKAFVLPRISVEPSEINLKNANDEPISNEDYEVDIRSATAGTGKNVVRDFVIRPLIRDWFAEGTLISNLGKSLKELKEDFIKAGQNIGVGANRINGFGRFEVINFEEVKE